MSQKTAIPQHIIDQVNEIDIVDVVNDYVSLKRSGVNWIGLCPFHTDKSPSFYVSPSKQICKCFACGNPEKGGVIHFVQQIEGVSFPSAVRLLAKKHNIDIPEIQLSPEDEAREKRKESQYIALAAAQQQFENNYLASSDTQNYINNVREVSEPFRKLYGIGYAPGDNQLTKLFPSKGYKTDTLISVDLIKQHEESDRIHDTFRNRAIFPYYDLQGRIIGFTGRDLSGQVEERYKYFNTATTDLFSKSAAIWGLWQAKKRISETGKVHIVEGQMDTVSFAQNGLQNTVAGSGTAFTDAQVKILHRFADVAVLVYDGDKAGIKASLKQIQTLLSYGMTVRCFRLPEGMDPDDMAKKMGSEYLPQKIQQGEQSFEKYMFDVLDIKNKEKEERIEGLDAICECIACIPDNGLQSEYIRSVATLFDMADSVLDIKERVSIKKKSNRYKPVVEVYSSGFYGMVEASTLLEESESLVCELTFSHDRFISNFSDEPLIYAHGSPSMSDIQGLRKTTTKFRISACEEGIIPDIEESASLEIIKALHFSGFNITVDSMIFDGLYGYFANRDATYDFDFSFAVFYIESFLPVIKQINDSSLKDEILQRIAGVMAELPEGTRATVMQDYCTKDKLRTTVTILKQYIKSILEKRNDKRVNEMKRIAFVEDSEGDDYDNGTVPDYVYEDRMQNYIHTKYGFYARRNKKTGEEMYYMFRNADGKGYSEASNFVIEPLLHIDSADSQSNKRVMYLRHQIPAYSRYVEWPSKDLIKVDQANIKFFESGKFFFSGGNREWKNIIQVIMDGFTECREVVTFGQQASVSGRDPSDISDVFIFSNAIFHKVKDENSDKYEYQISYADKIGVVNHGSLNFYLPDFSEIRMSFLNASGGGDNQAVHLQYKEIPEDKRICFDEWASLMDEVYKVNNNGKFAILYAFLAAFRDIFFNERRFFTAPFFMGPPSSGKSQIATSIRSLFMNLDAPLFNLNTGTPASLFIQMEKYRNIVMVLEEYNDKEIDDNVFQQLKAAVYDGQGKSKTIDASTKKTAISQVNVPLVLLGQNPPTRDNGSLASRCILCDVPFMGREGFSEKETEIYLRLKKHERTGLQNVLIEVLSLRDSYKKHFLNIFDAEVKVLSNRVKSIAINTDGLTRITNTVSLFTAACKFIETQTKLNLPFSYETFFELAVTKIVTQLEQIATTNNLGAFFGAVNVLLTRGKILKGRDLLFKRETSVTRVVKGKEMETFALSEETNVLYLDLNAVFSDYEIFVGSESATKQTILLDFKSNPAYLGNNRAVRYNWHEFSYGTQGGIDNIGEIDKRAVPKMERRDRTGSAHMFNYDMLKTLFEIDLERIEYKEQPKNDTEPPMFNLSSPNKTTDDDLPF